MGLSDFLSVFNIFEDNKKSNQPLQLKDAKVENKVVIE
jgi:hypothetical protein